MITRTPFFVGINMNLEPVFGAVTNLVVHPANPFVGDVVTVIGKTTNCDTLVVVVKGHNGATIPYKIQCIDGTFNLLFKCPDYGVGAYNINLTFTQPDQPDSTKVVTVRRKT